jgi:guanylate kinase
MNELVITITGPSCTGKSTLAKKLIDTGKYTEIVSTTTRPMRAGDVNGVSYHFVSKEQFDTIEMLETIHFNGNYYGGSVAEFEEKFQSGLTPVIVVEPNGMQQINNNAKLRGWKVLNIFIDIPAELQAKRFLIRFIEDYFSTVVNQTRHAQSSDEIHAQSLGEIIGIYKDIRSKEDSLLTEYSNRLASMQTVESQWLDMFHKWASDNYLYYLSFDSDNSVQVLSEIMNNAEHMLT